MGYLIPYTDQTAMSSDGDHTFIVYFYHGDPATGILKNMTPTGIYAATWFNPQIGKYTRISSRIRPVDGQWRVPPKPDSADWVLLVQQK